MKPWPTKELKALAFAYGMMFFIWFCVWATINLGETYCKIQAIAAVLGLAAMITFEAMSESPPQS